MNLVLEFLAEEADRLERYGIGSPPSFVLLTQRNWTSKYVVFVVLARESREPGLVVKVVRVPGFGDAWLAREAANLDAAHASRPGGFATIPRLVAQASSRGRPLLAQTALAGRALDPAVVRRNRSTCVARALDWLRELPVERSGTRSDPGWYARLVEVPIRRFAGGGERDALVEQTLALVEPLRRADLPLVLEHGDLSHPNLIALGDGRVGVIDWELAEPRGLPLTDLVFFLTYVAFAVRSAFTVERQLRAFDEAFFRPGAWARPLVAAEAERVAVPPPLLTPLFVACWGRYVARLVERLEPLPLEAGRHTAHGSGSHASIEASGYAALWRHAVARSGALAWARGS